MKLRAKSNTNTIFYEVMIALATLDAVYSNTVLPEIIKNIIHNSFLLGFLLFSILHITQKKFKYNPFLLTVFLFVAGIYSYYISGNTDFIISLVLIILVDKIDVDKILKIIFELRCFAFFSVIGLSLLGILEKGAIAENSAEKGVLFGFGHANIFAGNAGIIILLMLAVKRKKLSDIHLLGAFFAEIIIFYFSRARISILLIPLTIVLILLCRIKNFKIMWLKKGKYIFPVLLSLNYLLIAFKSLGIGTKIIDVIDILFNGRIMLAAMNLAYYPITIFGQKVDLSIIAKENQYYALDNGYTYLLIYYGIVGVGIYIYLLQKSFLECCKNKDIVLSIITVIFMMWLVYEGMMLSATSNFTLLFAFGQWKKNRSMITKNNREEYNDT